MTDGRVKLGEPCRDVVTGYSGTATARSGYLGGQVSIRIERADATGKPEEVWVPETRVESTVPAPVVGFGSPQ